MSIVDTEKNMTIQETIETVIEGGWKAPWGIYSFEVHSTWIEDVEEENCYAFGDIFLDPLFWQSLGRAVGWKDPKVYYYSKEGKKDWMVRPPWLKNWRHFIDHLASGKSAEDFFKELK